VPSPKGTRFGGFSLLDTAAPIERIDFWGESERGAPRRAATVKAGLYWCVWANYYQETRLPLNAEQTQGD
jgi:hypothetical protein